MSDNECTNTVFENITSGKWVEYFVWAGGLCIVFAVIEPITPDHALVIPRHVYERWMDTPASAVAHLAEVAHTIGIVQEENFDVPRSGLIIMSSKVSHIHLHVILLRSEAGALLSNVAPASDEALDEMMDKLCEDLRAVGYGANVPFKMSFPTSV